MQNGDATGDEVEDDDPANMIGPEDYNPGLPCIRIPCGPNGQNEEKVLQEPSRLGKLRICPSSQSLAYAGRTSCEQGMGKGMGLSCRMHRLGIIMSNRQWGIGCDYTDTDQSCGASELSCDK